LLYLVYWMVLFAGRPLERCTVLNTLCNPVYLSAEDVEVVEAQGSGLPIYAVARLFFLFNALSSLTFVVVALVLVWRKSNDWMALLLSAILLSLGTTGFSPSEEIMLPGALNSLIGLIAAFGYFAPGGMLFIFPDGRAVPRWSRWLTPIFFVVFPLLIMATSSLPDELILTGPFGLLFFMSAGISMAMAVGCMVYRYRRMAGRLQRQQLKWVALGLGSALAATFTWIFLAAFFPVDQPSPQRTLVIMVGYPLLLTLISLFPISVGVAVLRYRLWDIDVIIRRTLVYSTLTILLALTYFGMVVLVQFFVALTGQPSQLALVASTLFIAALFTPLRRRVQAMIDRRFYRRKYNAEQVLARFAATMRDETDLDAISSQLLGVIAETMQPEQVSLWLRPSGDDGVMG
jgi:hypothetical protein